MTTNETVDPATKAADALMAELYGPQWHTPTKYVHGRKRGLDEDAKQKRFEYRDKQADIIRPWF